MDTEKKINNEKLEQVNLFKYSEEMEHNRGHIAHEWNKRISTAVQIYLTLKNGFFFGKKAGKPRSSQCIDQYNICAILIFRNESWVLTKAERIRKQATEKKNLKRVKGVTKKDKIRKDDIRQELNPKPVIKKIEKQQLWWFGHQIRINKEILK